MLIRPSVLQTIYTIKDTNDLQSVEIGEALEDVHVETADAVVGQISEAQRQTQFWFIPSITQTEEQQERRVNNR